MPSEPILWKIQLRSPPERVHETLATAAGRARFWAESAEERDGVIHFEFSNGMKWSGRLLASEPPRLFAVEYFGGSRATFRCDDDGRGGTELTLTEEGVPEKWRHEHYAGWIPVLLTLKGAVDFGFDLRNRDPARSWEARYVDI